MALGKAYASEGRMSGAVKVLSEGAAKDPRLALPAALSHIPQMWGFSGTRTAACLATLLALFLLTHLLGLHIHCA